IALSLLIGSVYLFNLLMNREQNPSPIVSNSPAILTTPSVSAPPTPENPSPENKSSYNQLSIYLTDKNWKAADNETYILLLKAAGSKSLQDGTFHPDELNRISCADIVLIDQLWKQATDSKQGLTAQKKILASFGKDIRQTYESLGWINASGELIVDTAYDRQTSRWEYIEGRQPNFKSPPVGHLPFLLRDPHKNLERMVTLYRCSP
ncbi:MAG: GUN4 domain-containing protein, partial [Pseudanabaena sp. ELA748]